MISLKVNLRITYTVILMRLEEEKALIKVTGARHGRGLPPKCQHSGQDSNDLQHFWEGHPQWQEPSVPAVVSTTTAILSEEQEEQGQEVTQPTRVEQTVASVEYINNLTRLMSTLTPIPYLSGLPPTGLLPHYLCNWQNITTDLWVLQVVSGYKLELLSIPVQTFQPLDKGAVKIVNPCPNQ